MQLKVGENQKELKTHGSYGFPVDISLEQLSSYDSGAFICHWHPEVEFTLVLSGEIDYMVNDHHYHLNEMDGLFCNSNALHAGHRCEAKDCQYISIAFHPRMLYGFESSRIETRYVTPVISDPSFGSFLCSANDHNTVDILIHLRAIYDLKQTNEKQYEMQIVQHLLALWCSVCRYYDQISTLQPKLSSIRPFQIERLRSLFDYIHTHYQEALTLDEIAESINLSKSECCRFFKKHTNQSLFEYILYYRIEKSLPLLIRRDQTITEIATETGFLSTSYYCKIFKRFLGCTPKEYQLHSYAHEKQ